MSAFKLITDQLQNDPTIMSSIREEPVFLANGKAIPNKKALIRECDDHYLSTVGHNYRVTQPENVIKNFSSSLDNSKLDLNGLKVNVSQSENGLRKIVMLRLPEHRIETRANDETELQLSVRDSNDGSWPFKVDVGGFRIACANGQFDGDFISAFTSRHTKNFTYDGMVDGLDSALDMFDSIGEKWLSYRKVKVSKDVSENLILSYLGKNFSDKDSREAYMNRKSVRRDELFTMMGEYGKSMGWNLLAVYNAMTDDASHNNPDPLTQFTRGQQLSQICDTHLALAA